MGTHCSSANNRGQKIIMKLLILLTTLAAVALAEPWGYYGYPYHYGYYHQQAWPSASAPRVSSTCYGCRGKRSAEPEPYYGYGGYYGGYYGYPYAYGYRAYGPGIAGHPGAATSYTHRSPQGIGKRSAEPEPHYPFFGFYGYPYYVRPAVAPVAAPEGTGIAGHPGLATSFTSRVLKAPRPKDLMSPNLATATLTTVTVINFNGLAIVPLDFPVPFGVLEGKT